VPGFLKVTIEGLAWSPANQLFIILPNSQDYYATSPDGVNWQQVTLPVNLLGVTQFSGIAWSPELNTFLAAGTASNISMSSDGVTWSDPISINSNETAYRVVWTNDTFVVFWGGASSVISFSSDGITWTNVNSGFSVNWTDIAWSPDLELYAVVSSSGKILIGPDKDSITDINTGSNWWQTVLWSSDLGIFITFSDNGSATTDNARMAYSFDGITWNRDISIPESTIKGSVWSKELGRFIIVGFKGRIFYTSFKKRNPTSYTVFNSNINSVDEEGNWSFKSIETDSIEVSDKYSYTSNLISKPIGLYGDTLHYYQEEDDLNTFINSVNEGDTILFPSESISGNVVMNAVRSVKFIGLKESTTFLGTLDIIAETDLDVNYLCRFENIIFEGLVSIAGTRRGHIFKNCSFIGGLSIAGQAITNLNLQFIDCIINTLNIADTFFSK